MSFLVQLGQVVSAAMEAASAQASAQSRGETSLANNSNGQYIVTQCGPRHSTTTVASTPPSTVITPLSPSASTKNTSNPFVQQKPSATTTIQIPLTLHPQQQLAANNIDSPHLHSLIIGQQASTNMIQQQQVQQSPSSVVHMSLPSTLQQQTLNVVRPSVLAFGSSKHPPTATTISSPSNAAVASTVRDPLELVLLDHNYHQRPPSSPSSNSQMPFVDQCQNAASSHHHRHPSSISQISPYVYYPPSSPPVSMYNANAIPSSSGINIGSSLTGRSHSPKSSPIKSAPMIPPLSSAVGNNRSVSRSPSNLTTKARHASESENSNVPLRKTSPLLIGSKRRKSNFKETKLKTDHSEHLVKFEDNHVDLLKPRFVSKHLNRSDDYDDDDEDNDYDDEGEDLHREHKDVQLDDVESMGRQRHTSFSEQQQDDDRGGVSSEKKPTKLKVNKSRERKRDKVGNDSRLVTPNSSSAANTSSKLENTLSGDNCDEGITRCICEYLHDDGYMISCDKCFVWQHVECVFPLGTPKREMMGDEGGMSYKSGENSSNVSQSKKKSSNGNSSSNREIMYDIPEVYYCEQCQPRWVFKSRAKAIQFRKREYIKKGLAFDSPLMMAGVGGLSYDGENPNVVHSKMSPTSGSSQPLFELDQREQQSLNVPENYNGKTSKLKRRGRPSFSNGVSQSDSDTEQLHIATNQQTPKRARRKSNGKGQGQQFDGAGLKREGKIKVGGSRRSRKTSSEPRVKRSYTRRSRGDGSTNVSSKGYNDLVGTSDDQVSSVIVNHDSPVNDKERIYGKDLETIQSTSTHYNSDAGVAAIDGESQSSFSDSQKSGNIDSTHGRKDVYLVGNEDGYPETGGIGTREEVRRTKAPRKQVSGIYDTTGYTTLRAITNGDLSPPHIISSHSSPTESLQTKVHGRTSVGGTADSENSINQGLNNSFFNTSSSSSSSTITLPSPESQLVPSNFPGSSPTNNHSFEAYNSNHSLLALSTCPYSTSTCLDKYDEATACHYSQELRAKLPKTNGIDNSAQDFSRNFDGEPKWRFGVYMLEGGVPLKILLADRTIEPNEAVIEFIGKFKTLSQFVPGNKKFGHPNSIVPEPFAFFHQIPKNGICISIDCRKYGNAARFVRRSCRPNAEIRHVTVGKGTVHVYVVTTQRVHKDEEVTIPHEYKAITSNVMNSIVQKYTVLDPPLPCACTDLSLCTAAKLKSELTSPLSSGESFATAISVSNVATEIKKKNGLSVNASSAALGITTIEKKERKRRVSSRRTSLISIEKDTSEDTHLDETISSPDGNVRTETPTGEVFGNVNIQAPNLSPVDVQMSEDVTPKVEPIDQVDNESKTTVMTMSPSSSDQRQPYTVKERSAKVRHSMGSSGDETYYPPSTRKSKNNDSLVTPSTARQRNRSGSSSNMDTSTASQSPQSTPNAAFMSHADEKKMTREERKLQSVLKLIERMENNQKKKEFRLKEKKEKEKDKKDDNDELSDTRYSQPVKFPPNSARKKGKRRGRSGSGSHQKSPQKPLKPQLISQRSSGSAGDVRSTSTESDINSADEAGRYEHESPQRDGSSFRFPKKLLMSEWMNEKVDSVVIPLQEGTVPSQYIRKSFATTSTATPVSSTATSISGNILAAAVAATASSATISPTMLASTPTLLGLTHPFLANLDSGSAKKRWLRQAISEETEPTVGQNTSRPDSPDCVAPLKKRRLARASMSSEVSNTPPSTPHFYLEESEEKEFTSGPLAQQNGQEVNNNSSLVSSCNEEEESSDEDDSDHDDEHTSEDKTETEPELEDKPEEVEAQMKVDEKDSSRDKDTGNSNHGNDFDISPERVEEQIDSDELTGEAEDEALVETVISKASQSLDALGARTPPPRIDEIITPQMDELTCEIELSRAEIEVSTRHIEEHSLNQLEEVSKSDDDTFQTSSPNESPAKASKKSRWDQIDSTKTSSVATTSSSFGVGITKEAVVVREYIRNPSSSKFTEAFTTSLPGNCNTPFEQLSPAMHSQPIPISGNVCNEVTEPQQPSEAKLHPQPQCVSMLQPNVQQSAKIVNPIAAFAANLINKANVNNKKLEALKVSTATPAKCTEVVAAPRKRLSIQDYQARRRKLESNKSESNDDDVGGMDSNGNPTLVTVDLTYCETHPPAIINERIPVLKSNEDLRIEDSANDHGVVLTPWTPTLAERKREEMRERLSNLGIIRLDATPPASAVTGIGSVSGDVSSSISGSKLGSGVISESSLDPNKIKPNGDTTTFHPSNLLDHHRIASQGGGRNQPVRRLSVPTAGALKQLPPLPPHLSVDGTSTSNVGKPNGFLTSATSSVGRSSVGRPSSSSTLSSAISVNYSNSSSAGGRQSSISSSTGSGSQMSNPSTTIIGGVPLSNLIPPPPAPSGNQPTPVFGVRFYNNNKSYYPQS